MFYLALDLSTKSSGYSVFEDKKLIEYGCITAASTNVWHRIDKMIVELDKILQQYQFSHIYIEDVYPEDVKENLTVWKTLTYLQGFVLHLLDKYNLKCTFLTASSWRSKCGIHTGRGIKRESLKANDKAFVKNQFGLDVNDDVADSICIGCAALGVTPIQSEVSKTADGFEFG